MKLQLTTCGLTLLLLAAEPPADVKLDQYGDPLPPGAIARLGSSRFRAESNIIFAALSPDKKLIATSTPHTLAIWDAQSGKPIPAGVAPKPWVVRASWPEWLYCLAFSPDGQVLAVSVISYNAKQKDHQIRLYDVKSARLLRTITLSNRHADKVAFSPDGRFLFTILHDDLLSVWDAKSGELVKSLPDLPANARRFIFSRDGKTVAIAEGSLLVTQIHDLATGKLVKRIENQDLWSGLGAAFFPDGKTFVTIRQTKDRMAAKESRLMELAIGEIESGKIKLRSTPIHRNKVATKESQSGVRSICVSPDGKWVAMGNGLGREDGEASIILFEASTLKETARFYEPGESQHVYGLEFLDNDSLMTWGNHYSVTLWDLKTRKRKLPMDGPETPVKALAFSRDDRTLIQVAQRGLNAYRSWDYVTNEIKEGGNFDYRSRPGIACDGTLLFSIMEGGKSAQLLDVRRQEPIAKWPVTTDSWMHALSVDGRLVAMSPDGSREPITVYESKTGARKDQIDLNKHNSSIAVVFSPDNRHVFCGTDNGIAVYDADLHKAVPTIGGNPPVKKPANDEAGPFRDMPRPRPVPGTDEFERERKRQQEELQQLQASGYHIKVQKLIISADGKRLFSLGTDVRIWDVASRRQCRVIPWKPLQTNWLSLPLALAPNNRTLAVARPRGEDSGSISILDIFTGKELHTFPGHFGAVSVLAFSHDGRLLASGSEDTTTLLWDLSVLPRKFPQPVEELSDDQLTKYWRLLAGEDPLAAFDALARLIDKPSRSVPFAKKQLAKTQPVSEQAIIELIAKLDADEFDVREQASRSLANLGWTAEPVIQRALAKKPNPEVARRLKDILARLPEEKLDLPMIFASRLTEMLEQVNTPDSRDLLTSLAKGIQGAPLTREAAASLDRLKARVAERR